MKRLLFSVLSAALFALPAVGQTTLRGRVVDAVRGEGIAYATVAAVRDSIPVAANHSDAGGAFTLEVREAGEYKLEISAVGYSPVVKDISLAGGVLDTGTTALREGVEVDAVAITVQKPIVTADAEKLTYSVEDDPEAQSSTLEDIIRKVPQLTIDAEGNVLMNGQKDYKILVNGHTSGSMGRNFRDVIRSMPASSVKRIEVITNPSMKYDAEGTGGVLNIITSRRSFDGYNGYVNAYTMSWFNRNVQAGGSGSFTVSTGKFSVSASLYPARLWARDAMGESYNRSENLMWTPQSGSYKSSEATSGYAYGYPSIYGSLSASWQVDSLNLLTAEASYWGYRTKMRYFNPESRYYGGMDELLYGYTGEVTEREREGAVEAALNFEHRFGRDDHTLTISDAISASPGSRTSSDSFYMPLDGVPFIDMARGMAVCSTTRALENVVQADYRNILAEHHTVEAGAKYLYAGERARSLNTALAEDGSAIFESHGDNRLAKHVAALYAGYSYTRTKYSVRAGGRIEGAWNRLRSDNDGEPQRYGTTMFNVVPYLSFTFTPATAHSLSFAYTERLSRPGIRAMSPYIDTDVVARTRRYGNPALRAGVSHTLTLKYNYTDNKWGASAGIMTMLSDNLVTQYSFYDDEGIFNSTYANRCHQRVYGLEGTLSFRPSQKFNLSLSMRGGHIATWLPEQNIRTEGWACTQSLNMSVAMWKGSLLTLGGYAVYPDVHLGWRAETWMIGTSARIVQKLLKEKMELALSLRNPHEKNTVFRTRTETPTIRSIYGGTNPARSLSLSVTYRFGKQGLFVKSTHRKADDTETVGGRSGMPGGGAM